MTAIPYLIAILLGFTLGIIYMYCRIEVIVERELKKRKLI